MTQAPASPNLERVWLSMSDSNRTRLLSRALAKGLGMVVYMGPTLDQEGPISLLVCDDAHTARIAAAKTNAAPFQKTLLVTAGAKRIAGVDIYLQADTDAGTIANAMEGLRNYRNLEVNLGSNAEQDIGAIATLRSGEFSVQTLDEAREVALFIARGCPASCQISVGIFTLLANAIEHGNLEFSSNDKAKGLAEGKWRHTLIKKLAEREFSRRRVRIQYQRGGRLISLIIHDDGPGIDAETAEMADPTRASYRGKGIKAARSLGFSQISYLGAGNIVEASILLPQPAKQAAKVAVAS